MQLVVDANILIAALIKDSKTRSLFRNEELELLAPAFLLEELKVHQKEVLQKSSLSQKEFLVLLEFLKKRIRFEEKTGSDRFLKQAMEISPDLFDAPYLAICRKYKISLWSNDQKLKKQSLAPVFSTKELAEWLEATLL